MQPVRLSFVFTILNQKEFRIATVAMFTCDLYAGFVPQMSPPPHDLERLRTTLVDFIVMGTQRRVVDFVRVGYFIPLNGPLNGHPPSLHYILMPMLSEWSSSGVDLFQVFNNRPGYAPDWRYRGWFRAQPQSWRSSRRPYCNLRYCLVTWSPSEASAHATWSTHGLVCDGTSHEPKFHSEN